MGQKLRVNLRRDSHFGSIIQITKAWCDNEIIRYNYKYIENTRHDTWWSACGGFEEDSLFGRNLIPVEDSKVVITVDGNETTARMFENGECVKTATAKCNPSDEFNFEIGAKLAFERLFEEKPKFKAGDRVRIIGNHGICNCYEIGEIVTVRNITLHDNLNCINSKDCIQIVSPEDVELATFKVGDRVRIREWNDMIKEFGHDACGNIKVPFKFTKYMTFLCGRTATIKDLCRNNRVILDFDDKSGDTHWSFSPEMLEHASEKSKSLLNTKICITNGDDDFKTGQIYDVVNGKIKQRDGTVLPFCHSFYSLDELKDYFSPRKERKLHTSGWGPKIEFIEVKE